MLVCTVAILLLTQSRSVARHSASARRPGSVNLRAHPSTSTSMVSGGDGNTIATSQQNGKSNKKNGKSNKENEDDGSHWRIWSVIEELETNGLSSNTANTSAEDDMTNQVVKILQHWGESWAGQKSWRTLLDKRSLLHEVEESIVALQLLVNWLENRHDDESPVTLVDVCCGKGILSMLASYLFRGKTSTHVSSIIMLDKQEDVNWNHIVASNDNATEEGRPLIKTWGGCNLNEIDQVVAKLEGRCDNDADMEDGKLALVGIHLCKSLSPSCAGIVNALGPEKCPFLCLAPCCLPRVVRNLASSNNGGMIPNRTKTKSGKEGAFVVPVRKYESAEERQSRIEANSRRDGAKKRTFKDLPCYLCSEIHPIQKCHLLPADENERFDIFQKAQALTPCWKCGEIGHFKADCPSTQQVSKPRLVLPPTNDLDVASVLVSNVNGNENKGPFESYCELLATAVERDNVKVFNVGLVNDSVQHNAANDNNWNRDRKSIYIVASA